MSGRGPLERVRSRAPDYCYRREDTVAKRSPLIAVNAMLCFTMIKRLWGAVCLLCLASCGGSTQDGAQADQSTSASESSSEACEDLESNAISLINAAVRSAPTACTADSDCLIYRESADCVFSCGVEAAVTDATGISNAIATVKADFCRDECRSVPPSCNGGDDVESSARCVAGACTIVRGE